MPFAERLQEAMRLRRLSQGQLAAKSGISQPHISRLIQRKREPTLDRLVRLADALDVSLDWLVGRESVGAGELSLEEDELVQRFRRITNPALRHAILQTALSFVDAEASL